MTPAVDVVGLGENSVDLVYRFSGPLTPNGKVPIREARISAGGQVATTLCACARLGLTCAYVGTFGNDERAAIVRSALDAAGVRTDAATQRGGPNRYAVILLDEQTGARTVLWQRDVRLAMRPDEIPTAAVTAAKLLHVDNVDEEAAIAAARLARDAGLHVTTDIDAVGSRTAALVAAATLPVLAEHVPAALTGEPDPERALRQLRARHGGMLCVTLGERGALLVSDDQVYRQPVFSVRAVDTTGAGDVFRGALIFALLRGDDPAAMLRFAAAAAAASCRREGAIASVPDLAEVEALLASV